MLKVFIKLVLAAALVAGLTLQSRSAHAAVSAYLSFTDYNGKAVCAGESTQTAHPGAIELSDFSFSLAQTLNIGSQSSGAGAGKVTFNPFSFTKKFDAASPCFAQYLSSGQALASATLYLRKAAGGTASGQDYLVVTFKLVAFKTQNWTHDDSAGAGEVVTFEYGAYQIKYYPQRTDGSLGQPVTSSWNRVQNTATVPDTMR
jgi:type VI secretion system Hcp family effector